MIEYALAAPGWTEGRQWYYGEDMLRQLMGIGGVGLQYYPEAPLMIERMEELYRRWAIEHLGRDEDNIEGFCYFLSEPQGASLRLKALPWIAAALEEGTRSSHWHREGTGSALLHYLDALISRDGAAIARLLSGDRRSCRNDRNGARFLSRAAYNSRGSFLRHCRCQVLQFLATAPCHPVQPLQHVKSRHELLAAQSEPCRAKGISDRLFAERVQPVQLGYP